MIYNLKKKIYQAYYDRLIIYIPILFKLILALIKPVAKYLPIYFHFMCHYFVTKIDTVQFGHKQEYHRLVYLYIYENNILQIKKINLSIKYQKSNYIYKKIYRKVHIAFYRFVFFYRLIVGPISGIGRKSILFKLSELLYFLI